MFFIIVIRMGMKISIRMVENSFLNVSEIVVGIRYWVCLDVFVSSGRRLIIVVVVVRNMV